MLTASVALVNQLRLRTSQAGPRRPRRCLACLLAHKVKPELLCLLRVMLLVVVVAMLVVVPAAAAVSVVVITAAATTAVLLLVALSLLVLHLSFHGTAPWAASVRRCRRPVHGRRHSSRPLPGLRPTSVCGSAVHRRSRLCCRRPLTPLVLRSPRRRRLPRRRRSLRHRCVRWAPIPVLRHQGLTLAAVAVAALA